MVDFSHLSLTENIEKTKLIVAYAHERGVAVEGEVGVIAGVEDDIASDVQKLATFEDTMHYIEQTGVDSVAPACGTAHGTYKSEPCLNYNLIKQLSEATETALVLHGGTGLSDEQFRDMIDSGISKINLSTILKETWVTALTDHLPRHNVSSPMDIDIACETAFCDTALAFIQLFSNKGRGK
jgi:fructose/tagatose bisphosphate aldolase